MTPRFRSFVLHLAAVAGHLNVLGNRTHASEYGGETENDNDAGQEHVDENDEEVLQGGDAGREHAAESGCRVDGHVARVESGHADERGYEACDHDREESVEFGRTFEVIYVEVAHNHKISIKISPFMNR